MSTATFGRAGGDDELPGIPRHHREEDRHDLGRGHGMAFFRVLTKGSRIGEKHVGAGGVHGDESDTLRLDGLARRDLPPE